MAKTKQYLLAFLVMSLLSCGEFEVVKAENEYWCQMVNGGYWGSSAEEYIRKCL